MLPTALGFALPEDGSGQSHPVPGHRENKNATRMNLARPHEAANLDQSIRMLKALSCFCLTYDHAVSSRRRHIHIGDMTRHVRWASTWTPIINEDGAGVSE